MIDHNVEIDKNPQYEFIPSLEVIEQLDNDVRAYLLVHPEVGEHIQKEMERILDILFSISIQHKFRFNIQSFNSLLNGIKATKEGNSFAFHDSDNASFLKITKADLQRIFGVSDDDFIHNIQKEPELVVDGTVFKLGKTNMVTRMLPLRLKEIDYSYDPDFKDLALGIAFWGGPDLYNGDIYVYDRTKIKSDTKRT